MRAAGQSEHADVQVLGLHTEGAVTFRAGIVTSDNSARALQLCRDSTDHPMAVALRLCP